MISATLGVDAGPVRGYIKRVRRAAGVHVTPAHLAGRGAATVAEALPGLNGRVVFGSFAPSPAIDGFFVVSLRAGPVAGKEAAAAGLSGSVIWEAGTRPPWVIASELAQRAGMIRDGRDPQFKHGQPVVRPALPLCVSLDHRFVDGCQAASMARIFREYPADPARFDPVPAPERVPRRRPGPRRVAAARLAPAAASS